MPAREGSRHTVVEHYLQIVSRKAIFREVNFSVTSLKIALRETICKKLKRVPPLCVTSSERRALFRVENLPLSEKAAGKKKNCSSIERELKGKWSHCFHNLWLWKSFFPNVLPCGFVRGKIAFCSFPSDEAARRNVRKKTIFSDKKITLLE